MSFGRGLDGSAKKRRQITATWVGFFGEPMTPALRSFQRFERVDEVENLMGVMLVSREKSCVLGVEP
jgi:hypothetical protein